MGYIVGYALVGAFLLGVLVGFGVSKIIGGYRMKTCYDCKYRIIDKNNGDRCGKGDFPLMDSRFKYEYEIFKLQNGRPCYCPLAKSENVCK